MSDIRLAFCQAAPYAVWDSSLAIYRGAWLDAVNGMATDRNFTTSYVRPSESACLEDTRGALVSLLESDAADVAIYPFIFNYTYSDTVALMSAYPIDVGSPVFMTERQSDQISLFADPFSSRAWGILLAIFASAAVTGVVVDAHGRRSRHLPRIVLAAFDSVDLPFDASLSVYVLYCWVSVVSLLLFAVYSAILAQILLLNTDDIDTFARASANNVTISITKDIVDQLQLSNSPFSLVLYTNYNVVDTEDALDNLPVLVPWSVSSMMRQLSCKDLDSAYREVSKVTNSLLMRPDAPGWLYDDVKGAVLDRTFAKGVQNFVLDHPYCEERETYQTPELRYVLPLLYLGAVLIAVSWVLHFVLLRYETGIEELNTSLHRTVLDHKTRLIRSITSIKRGRCPADTDGTELPAVTEPARSVRRSS